MAWIYLVESEVFPSHSKNGLDQLPIAKSTRIVKESFSQEWPTDSYTLPPYGTILKPCHCLTLQEILTLSLEASPARISALGEMEKAWKESEADYFSRSCAYPKKSSPNSYSLKTSQQLHAEGDFASLEKLPKWGMIVDGVLYPLTSLSTKTAKDGFCLPNLVACDAKKGPAKIYNRSGKQASMRNLVTISYRLWNAAPLSPRVCERLMGYPEKWTELEPWAMQSCLNRRKKRLKS